MNTPDPMIGKSMGTLESSESLQDFLSVANAMGLACSTCGWQGPTRDTVIVAITRNEQGEMQNCTSGCPSCGSTNVGAADPLRPMRPFQYE